MARHSQVGLSAAKPNMVQPAKLLLDFGAMRLNPTYGALACCRSWFTAPHSWAGLSAATPNIGDACR
jgi:hypothetical protein